jgi:hypothetical protein
VLLYELLAGTPPFTKQDLDKRGLLEMLRIVREEEPPRPSTKLSTADALPTLSANRGTEPKKLTGLLRNELDWIVMKALEKDRTRRYETANGFAADVLRYLAGEPVLAHPPSTAYRVKKFVRRNRGQVIAASLILLTLVGGMIGTGIGYVRADRARVNEEWQRGIAEEAKTRAETAEAETLADYRASTDDVIEQLIGSKPVLGPQEKLYLQNTLKRWQSFANRVGDDERSQAIRAEGNFRVALLWHKLGQRDEARAAYETVRGIWQQFVDSHPDAVHYQQELARTHHNLAVVLEDLGERDAAK